MILHSPTRLPQACLNDSSFRQAQIEPQRPAALPPLEGHSRHGNGGDARRGRAASAPTISSARNRGRRRGRDRLTMAVTDPRAGNLSAAAVPGETFSPAESTSPRKPRHRLREDRAGRDQARCLPGADGKADPAKSRDQGLAIGVPGTDFLPGLSLAHQQYGSGKVHAGAIDGRPRLRCPARLPDRRTDGRHARRDPVGWRATGPSDREAVSESTARDRPRPRSCQADPLRNDRRVSAHPWTPRRSTAVTPPGQDFRRGGERGAGGLMNHATTVKITAPSSAGASRH